MDPLAGLGETAPAIELPDLSGSMHSLALARDQVIVLNFWSANCPWSEKADQAIETLTASSDWGESVRIWRVASNADESVDELRQAAEQRSVKPVLLDAEQVVADAYGAQTTPHLFVVDVEGVLRYRGALDDSSWREPEPKRNYLQWAISAALRGQSPEPAETPARGCTVVRHKAAADNG